MLASSINHLPIEEEIKLIWNIYEIIYFHLMSGVEIFLTSLQSVWAIGPDCSKSVRYHVKFVIDRVKKELFAFQVQHFTCNSNINACQPSYKQQIQDTIRSRTP